MPAPDLIENRWDDAKAAGMSEPEKLLYRSNLLGADKRVTNYGGGNTSAKVRDTDPLTGESVGVLWVKGSGGDVGTMKLEGFATLYMNKLEGMKALYRGVAHEDAMVGLLPHATFNLNTRAASIDTPLHAFVPYRHVDHMHPDAVIAIAAAADSQALTKRIYGDAIGWLPWKRPGFELGLWLEKFAREKPNAKGCVLGSHGLFTWADDARECYGLTLDIINRAIAWFKAETGGKTAFGGATSDPLPAEQRRAVAARLMPQIRGRISGQSGGGELKVGHFDDSPAVLDFVCSARLRELAALGTSCPDHFLRTKIRPIVLEFGAADSIASPGTGEAESARSAEPGEGRRTLSRDAADPHPVADATRPLPSRERQKGLDVDALVASLDDRLAAYRADYAAYYERSKHPDSPAMRDPNPVVYLVLGVGMITFARDKATARIAGEFYVNAINVMRGASGVSDYVGLAEQEAFDIEYWLLEEAKLQRMPKPKSLAGRVAFVTGGAGGIGRAIAERLIGDGACAVLADIDAAALETTLAEFRDRFGVDVVRGVKLDVTSEDGVIASCRDACVEYGGIDILVSNAGISSAANVEDTELSMWQRNMDILSTGYFLVSREAFRLFKAQKLGGAIVFIASKNGLAASPGASAYCTAKASEIHLARCLALEGAPEGIRVNVVNPDAVLRGSKIWQGEWREQRAAAYKMRPDELEEHYRQRSLLKRSVFPEDIAEAVYFLASDMSAKSTGNIVNVDGGNQISFTR